MGLSAPMSTTGAELLCVCVFSSSIIAFCVAKSSVLSGRWGGFVCWGQAGEQIKSRIRFESQALNFSKLISFQYMSIRESIKYPYDSGRYQLIKDSTANRL